MWIVAEPATRAASWGTGVAWSTIAMRVSYVSMRHAGHSIALTVFRTTWKLTLIAVALDVVHVGLGMGAKKIEIA